MLKGDVTHGKKRGKSLGFPTANIRLEVIVPEGVYVSSVKVDNKEYAAATFIGAAKTFNESEFRAESYILDFDRDIYGKNILIKLYNKIRENRKFASEEELVSQMEKDILQVKKYFQETVKS